MSEYRERAKIVKAIQWNGKNDDEISAVTGTLTKRRSNPEALELHHPDGDTFEHPVTKLPEHRTPSIVMKDFYVLKMSSGHLGVMSPAEFAQVYEGTDKRVAPEDAGSEKSGTGSTKKIMALLEQLSERIEAVAQAQTDGLASLRADLDSLTDPKR